MTLTRAPVSTTSWTVRLLTERDTSDPHACQRLITTDRYKPSFALTTTLLNVVGAQASPPSLAPIHSRSRTFSSLPELSSILFPPSISTTIQTTAYTSRSSDSDEYLGRPAPAYTLFLPTLVHAPFAVSHLLESSLAWERPSRQYRCLIAPGTWGLLTLLLTLPLLESSRESHTRLISVQGSTFDPKSLL